MRKARQLARARQNFAGSAKPISAIAAAPCANGECAVVRAMLTGIVALTTAIACSFIIGLTVNLGSTCAVNAAKDFVHRKEANMLVAFGIAIAVAGMLVLPAKWAFGGQVNLASNPAIGPALLAGSVMLGVGAYINGACLFGTLGRLGKGELRFLGLPVGLALGFLLEQHQDFLHTPAHLPNPLAQPAAAGFAALAVFASIFALSWLWLRKREGCGASESYWTLRRSMAVLGLFGAVQYALVPGTTYVDAIQSLFRMKPNMAAFAMPILPSIAALTGTVVAGIWSRRFRIEYPDLTGFARSTLGGMLMGVGGSWIPGGNDTLLLSFLPAAALGGVAAYLVMTATIFALLWARRAGRNSSPA
jgi:uncharacterized protein